MDPQAFDMGIWLGFACVAIPVSAVLAAVVVFRRQPIVIDARLIDASRRKAFDRIADFDCSDAKDEDLEAYFVRLAVDCAIEAFRAFNPDSRLKDEQLQKRFWAKCIVIGNAAILRMYFDKLGAAKLEAQNIPIERELRLKRPQDIAPNGGGYKTQPPPHPFELNRTPVNPAPRKAEPLKQNPKIESGKGR